MGATDLNGPTKYRYSDLKAATKNFNEKNKLGEGGFGAVYKVNLSFSLPKICFFKTITFNL